MRHDPLAFRCVCSKCRGSRCSEDARESVAVSEWLALSRAYDEALLRIRDLEAEVARLRGAL